MNEGLNEDAMLHLTPQQKLIHIQENLACVPEFEEKVQALEALAKKMTSEADKQEITNLIEAVKTKLISITSQAERRCEEIQVNEANHMVKEQELMRYQHLLQDLEQWLNITNTSITTELQLTDVDVMQHQVQAHRILAEDLATRDEELDNWLEACQKMSNYTDMSQMSQQLYTQLEQLKTSIDSARSIVNDRETV